MKNINCPVLSVHGRRDDITTFAHGRALYDAAKVQSFAPYWPEDAGHDDIEVVDWGELCLYYSEFLMCLRTRLLKPLPPRERRFRFWKSLPKLRLPVSCFS